MTPLGYNILFVCDFPFTGAGGVGRVTETLAAEFRRRGHSVTYLAFSAGEDHDVGGVRQLFSPDSRKIASLKNVRFLEQLLRNLGIDFIINQAGVKRSLIRLFAQVDRGRAKVLSVHHNSIAALEEHYPEIVAENCRGTAIASTLRHPLLSGVLTAYGRQRLRTSFRDALCHSDQLVLLSEHFIPELERLLGGRDTAASVAGIVNPAPFPVVEGVEERKRNRLVFVGRVEYQQKRCDLLLDVWAQLVDRFPDWSFDIVGDGSARGELEKQVVNEGLERIHFHGLQDPRPYLERAKLLCMTSAYEGYPMVLVEAQAYGVVPLAFNCFSALPDIIQSGENGCVIPAFALDEYATALAQLMKDDAPRQRLARAAQDSVSRSSPEVIGDKWEDLFASLVNAEPDGRA